MSIQMVTKKEMWHWRKSTGAGGGVTEISDQTGLGVRVEQIRRAFDEFLIDKARQASSNFKKAESFSDEVKRFRKLVTSHR